MESNTFIGSFDSPTFRVCFFEKRNLFDRRVRHRSKLTCWCGGNRLDGYLNTDNFVDFFGELQI